MVPAHECDGRAPMKTTMGLRSMFAMLLFVAMADALAADCAPPTRFEVTIGGVFGPSFEVRAESATRLVYRVNRRSFLSAPGTTQTRIAVSRAQWRAFCTEIEDIGVWRWQPRYEDPSVMDGTQWSARMQFGTQALDTSGYNAYPEQERFNRFLQAVRGLIGGREFR